jgi:DNA mismatch endonuclease, patch repair protein
MRRGIIVTSTDESGMAAPAMVASSARVSAQMSRQPRKDTQPEVFLRRLLFTRGFRYRVHLRVPGLPRRSVDIAFPGVKVAVFVDGCFWHGCPEHGTVPRSNCEWWRKKLDGNRSRDDETADHLSALGWRVLRFWSHEDITVMADTVAACVQERRTESSGTVAARSCKR